MKTRNIIPIVFVTLALIIGTEIFIYSFLTNYTSKINQSKLSCTFPTPTPFRVPQLTKYKTYTIPVKFPDITNQPAYEQAIHPEMVKDLATFIKAKQTSETYDLFITNKGVVTDLDLDGKKVGNSIFPFGIKFKDGEIDDWWYLSPQMNKVLSVTIESGGSVQKASLSDVAIGDNVILEEVNAWMYSPYDEQHSKAFHIRIMR